MTTLKRHKNSYLVLASMGVLLVTALCLYGASYYVYAKKIQQEQEKLEQLVKNRSDRIIHHVTAQIEFGKTIATNEVIQRAFDQLQSDPVPHEAKRGLTVFLEESGTNESYKNTLLISKEGKVLYSDFAPEYVGVHLTNSKHKNSALGESFMRALMGVTVDIAQIAYDEQLKRPALFITIPVFNKGTLLGILVQEIVMGNLDDILDDFKGLRTTGEIFFGEHADDGIIIINKSRSTKIPLFKRFIFHKNVSQNTDDYYLAQALSGYSGSDIILDENDKERVAAWQYIPKVQWGVLASISVQELEPTSRHMRLIAWLFLAALALLVAIFYWRISWYREAIDHRLRALNNPKALHTLARYMCGIIACIFSAYAYWFFRDSRASLIAIKQEVEERSASAKQDIEKYLKTSELIGHSLVANLSSGFIKKDAIAQRIKNNMRDYPNLIGITIAYTPYAYDKEQRLFSFYAKRKKSKNKSSQGIEVEQYPYDYTTINPLSDWGWYTLNLPYQSVKWLQAYYDPDTEMLVAGYSMTFFDEHDTAHTTPIGIVNIQFNLEPIINIVSGLEIGTLGYAYLLLSNGLFIYHPVGHYVSDRDDLYNLADEGGNERLSQIADTIIAGGKGFYTYKDPAETGETMWLYATHIAKTGWILNAIFSQEDASLSVAQVRFYSMTLLVIGTLFILFLLLALDGIVTSSIVHLATMTSTLLSISLALLLFIIGMTPLAKDIHPPTIISDQARQNKFLKDQDLYAQQIHEEVTTKIPVGIFITSLGFKNSTTIELSGYVWEHFPLDSDPSFMREVNFSQEIEPANFKKMYEKKDATGITVGWEFTAKLAQKFDYARYPFDAIMLKIGLEYPDRSKAVLLVPALSNYQSILSSATPGIDNKLSLSGYTFEKAFFGYDTQENDVNYGLGRFNNATDKTKLVHLITMSRSLLYDFVVVLLPLFIVFFCLFTVLSIAERQRIKGLNVLVAYTGLIFVVVTLHKALRDRLVFGDILYIEYLFFMIYVTFAVLVLFTLLKLYTGKIHHYIQKFLNFYKIFFWSIQLLALLIITFIVFYPT